MSKNLSRAISMLIIFAMMINIFPFSVFATELQSDTAEAGETVVEEQAEDVYILEEITEKRTEYSKNFKLSNGLQMAAVYPNAVHFQKDGQWEEIDNTLKIAETRSGNVYTNTAGSWQVSFPESISEAKSVSISKDNHMLSFRLAGELRSAENDNALSEVSENTEDDNVIQTEAGELVVEDDSIFSGDTETAPAEENTDSTAEATVIPSEPVESITEAPTDKSTDSADDKMTASEEVVADAQVQPVQETSATIEHIDVSAIKKTSQFEETIADKLISRIRYDDIYPNVDIVYDLGPNQLKESLIIKQYDATLLGYSYILEVGEMIPVLSENNDVMLYDADGDELIMVMSAPFLFDAADAYCYDVAVVLKESEGYYLLSYILPQEWLNDQSRQWPVTLDPVVSTIASNTNAEDQIVYENTQLTSPANASTLNVGYESACYSMRTYMRYNTLPSLTSADVIVSANIELFCVEKYGTNTTVEVREVLGSWSADTINWSNQPSYSSTVEDYVITTKAQTFYTWDITDIVRRWYAGSNYGMVFKTTDAQEVAKVNSWLRYYSADFTSTCKPTLSIVYRNNNGLESYWDYTASSAGRAGTGYINNYTGNLVWVHNDIGFGGNLMPVAVSHIYNANDSKNNTFGMGYGWRTNFNQRVYQWATDTSYFIWEDSDGTKHYFKCSSSGTYKDEDGLNLTLTTTGSGTTTYCITDKYGNRSYFDSYGRLAKLTNNQKTPSSITITYTSTSGCLISTITDGAGRVYSFSYSSNLLNKISFKGTGSNALSYVSFGYTSSKLTSVTYNDGEISRFTYTTNNLLSTAQDIDGYTLKYTYNTVTAGLPNRVQTVSETDGSASGGTLTIAYAQNQTTFKDYSGNVQIHQFNNWGNTVSIQDDQGRAQYAKYATDTSTSAKGNQLTVSSKLQNTVGNILNDSSFENSTAWTVTSSAVSRSIISGTAYLGSKSLQLTRSTAGTAAGVYSASFSAAAGETYTFSAYVKTGSASAYLALNDGSKTVTSEVLAANSGWTRLEVSYTASTAKTLTARLLTTGAGTIYMDCVQVEKAPTASRYNLIQNGDFRTTTFWSSSSGRTTSTAAAPELSTNVYRMTGSPTATNRIYQTVAVSGKAGDTFVLAGWAKGDSASLDNGDTNPREFGIIATFNNTDGTTTSTTVRFNPYVGSSVNWQYAAAAIVAAKAYSSIKIELAYDYNINTAYFDGIQLYKEQFGSSYTYDSNGNVISVKDLQSQTTTYAYTNNNLTSATLPSGAKLTYTYDNYHNVLTATSGTGVVYNFTYDAYGNNTSVSIVSGSTKLTSTATYTTDGNRLATTTDAAGNTTTYTYNANTNVLESVKYPKDSTTTKTSYTYDSMYRLASAAATTDTGFNLTASYTYTDDLLTKITTGSTTYNFSYGSFDLRSAITIGSRTLASYSYTSRTNYLSSLDYGNGDSVDYTYDKQGRLTKELYEDGDTVTYKYDNSGALAAVSDSATGITTKYFYDFTDRLMKYTESNGHIVSYGYDTLNNLTSLKETIGGSTRTTSYAYDKDNRVTTVTSGNAVESYTYDAYSRINKKVTKNGSTTVLTDTITYRAPSSGKTSGQVYTLKSAASGYSKTYTYGYDANGNITSVSDGTNTTTYVYDSANQLTRENNQAAGKTWVWAYDDAGNITSRTEYAYTTGTLGTVVDTVGYTYDTTWGDLLTAYDGNAIESDTIGNMTSDGTWTYTWEHGRELATMSNGSTTWTYTYNADGLRTKRTNGSTTYNYIYNGSSLSQMTVGSNTLYFAYDASGTPMSVTYNGTNYYYATNLQGDVTAILNTSGTAVVQYTYDAWGNILTTAGSMASTLGAHNPLRYRGYVWDLETGLYYLQSRYYDPEIGRFINADALVSTGQGILGNNMFAYCNNNPIVNLDPTGKALDSIWDLLSFGQSLLDVIVNPANPAAWFALGADAVCLVIPGLTGGGGIVRFVTNADDIADAAKYVDEVVDAAKSIKSSFETGNKMHDAYMILDESSSLFRNKTLGIIFEEVTSRLRPDAVDTANNILYELKPYNQDSFIRAIKQVQKYLEMIPDGTSDWTIVIDMYY